MRNLPRRLPRIFRRRPKVTLVVCSICQRQMAGEVVSRVMQGVAELDAVRHDLANGDPVKSRLLAEIEKQYVRGMADVHRDTIDPRFGEL